MKQQKFELFKHENERKKIEIEFKKMGKFEMKKKFPHNFYLIMKIVPQINDKEKEEIIK